LIQLFPNGKKESPSKWKVLPCCRAAQIFSFKGQKILVSDLGLKISMIFLVILAHNFIMAKKGMAPNTI